MKKLACQRFEREDKKVAALVVNRCPIWPYKISGINLNEAY